MHVLAQIFGELSFFSKYRTTFEQIKKKYSTGLSLMVLCRVGGGDKDCWRTIGNGSCLAHS